MWQLLSILLLIFTVVNVVVAVLFTMETSAISSELSELSGVGALGVALAAISGLFGLAPIWASALLGAGFTWASAKSDRNYLCLFPLFSVSVLPFQVSIVRSINTGLIILGDEDDIDTDDVCSGDACETLIARLTRLFWYGWIAMVCGMAYLVLAGIRFWSVAPAEVRDSAPGNEDIGGDLADVNPWAMPSAGEGVGPTTSFRGTDEGNFAFKA